MMSNTEKAMALSTAVNLYLRSKYSGELTWHPLHSACKDLFLFLFTGR